jgi:hypothetical protein
MLKERSTMHKVNQEAYALVFKDLLAGPSTAHELADVSGLHIVTMQSLMRTLKKHKVVHIVAWHPNGRGIDTTPVFQLGQGRDVKRRRKTRAQIAADYRERKQMQGMVNLMPAGETTTKGTI